MTLYWGKGADPAAGEAWGGVCSPPPGQPKSSTCSRQGKIGKWWVSFFLSLPLSLSFFFLIIFLFFFLGF